MTLKQLEYFVAIVDHGGISAAARELHISQPPLSMQIKALEDELGVQLLERTTRHFRLTDAGHKLYDRARSILDLVEETRYELEASEENIEGKLLIGSISSCGNKMLTEGFREFTGRYPDVDYELFEGHTYAMIDMIKKREIDLAFLRTPFDDEGLSCRYFPAEPMSAIGPAEMFEKAGPDSMSANSPYSTSYTADPGEDPPAHSSTCIPEMPRTHDGEKVTLEELASKPLIIYRRFEDLIRSAFRARGLGINVRCLNDDARTSMMWASAGVGICLVPSSIVPVISRRDGIISKTVDCDDFMTQVAIACRQGQYLSPAARKFIEVFEKETG